MASSSKPSPKQECRKEKVSKDKAFSWTPTLLRQFLDLLIAYQHKYGRDLAFSWVELSTQFEELTGKKCGTNMLKNKHDTMKDLWKEWKDLKHGETGLEWDYQNGCINATKEWWERKIQENGNFRRFQKKGIPPHVEEAWDQIYGGTVAERTGKRAAVVGASQLSKRQNTGQSTGSTFYQRHIEVVEENSSKLLAMLNAEEEASKTPKDQEVEVVEVLDELVAEGLIVDESPLLCFSIDALITPERARMFLACKRNGTRVAWLKYQFLKSGGEL